MAESPNAVGILATLLALGIAPTLGMMIGGGWVAAFAFLATAAVVTTRALSKHGKASADREAIAGELTPVQAIGMLSALRGQPLASSIHGKVEDLAKLAETDPVSAHARICDLLVESPRNVPALVLCARLAFELRHDDATGRWTAALRAALDSGLNRVAASTFVAHREHKDALDLTTAHRTALGHALLANGHAEDGTWARQSAATTSR